MPAADHNILTVNDSDVNNNERVAMPYIFSAN